MLNADALKQIFSVQSAAWTITAVIMLFVWRMWNGAPAMFAQWIAYKRARAEEKSAHWNRLQSEIGRLSDAERRCRDDYNQLHQSFIDRGNSHAAEIADLKTQIAEMRGYFAGYGKASQEAAGIVAIERLKSATDKDGPKGGGK